MKIGSQSPPLEEGLGAALTAGWSSAPTQKAFCQVARNTNTSLHRQSPPLRVSISEWEESNACANTQVLHGWLEERSGATSHLKLVRRHE